jgi:hypothetical protein
MTTQTRRCGSNDETAIVDGRAAGMTLLFRDARTLVDSARERALTLSRALSIAVVD